MSDKPKTVAPTVKKMERDSSMVTVTFPAGSLARGWCYELQIATPAFNTEHDLVKEDLNLCMTNCMCDWVGTSKCEEHTGKCHCKFPHTGPDCSQCEKGHTRDPTSGQCVPASVCVEQGGKEDCNGHGICNMRGNAAVCECDPGFINDGLEQCGRCTDPLFTYPDCKVRNWIIEEPDINCRDLKYKMPKTLYDKKGQGDSL